MPLRRACSWIDSRLGDFALAPARSDHDEPFWASLKALAELAHAGDFLHRAKDPRGARWVNHAWQQVRHGELLHEVLAKDPRLLPVILTMIPFHLTAHHHAGVLAIAREHVPRAELSALEWTFVIPALEILGIAVADDIRARGRARSVRHGESPAADLQDDAAYILAHECFYAARWGHASPLPDEYLASTLPMLVERARANADADLLAEVILASRCSNIRYDPRVFEVLAAAQTPAGNILPPPRLETQHRRFVHPTMSRTYHTTLAAIMAWAADIVPA